VCVCMCVCMCVCRMRGGVLLREIALQQVRVTECESARGLECVLM